MKVKDLKLLLATAPDDAPVVAPAFDHSYREVRGGLTTALEPRKGQWSEDHGEEITPQAAYGKRVPVFLIS